MTIWIRLESLLPEADEAQKSRDLEVGMHVRVKPVFLIDNVVVPNEHSIGLVLRRIDPTIVLVDFGEGVVLQMEEWFLEEVS